MKSIKNQLLLPTLLVIISLTLTLIIAVSIVLTMNYEKTIYSFNDSVTEGIAHQVEDFTSMAYRMTEQLAVSPSIVSMQTGQQTPVLAECLESNEFFELFYAQGTDGMQTGRSHGELGDRSNRWWFVRMMEEPAAFISESYYSVNTNMPCASVFAPIEKNGKMVGIMASDIKLDSLQALVLEAQDEEAGRYSFLIDGKGVVVAHPDNRYLEELYNFSAMTKTVTQKDEQGVAVRDQDGNIITEVENFTISNEYMNVIQEVMKGSSVHKKINTGENKVYISCAPVVLDGNSESWSVITLQDVHQAMALRTNIIVIACIIGLIVLVLSIILISIFISKKVEPIHRIAECSSKATEGDFKVHVDVVGNNELTVLATNFNALIKKLGKFLGLSVSVTEDIMNSYDTLAHVESTTESLNQKMETIKEGCDNQKNSSNLLSSLSAKMKEQFVELQEENQNVVNDMHGVGEIQVIGVNSIDALQAANELTKSHMQETYTTMQELNQQAANIMEVLEGIKSISSETSMLALNASIEAARAGEFGRGFAIVAQQISKLSTDSDEATKNAAQILEGISEGTKNVVCKVEQVNEIFENQSTIVAEVRDSFYTLKDDSEHAANGVGHIEQLINTMQALNADIDEKINQIEEIITNTWSDANDTANDLVMQQKLIHDFSGKINDLSQVSQMLKVEMKDLEV